MTTFRYTLLISVALVFARVPFAFSQGALTPPGAPAPTMKTLDQIASTGIAVNTNNTPGDSGSMFIITQPGSYYLTGNLNGVSGKNGILIRTNNVTLDLNGFQVLGTGGSLIGITDGSGNRGNTTIRNGTIRLWGASGIALSSSFDTRFEQLISTDNGATGFTVGDAAAVSDCIARNNAGDNFQATFNANFHHCLAVGSLIGMGFNTGSDCVLNDCVASFNKIFGMIVGANSQLTGCVAGQNLGPGIITGNASVLTSCSASANAGTGIQSGSHSSLAHCSASQNTTGSAGIFANVNSSISDCTASGNFTQFGIVANPGSVVSHCSACNNIASNTISAGIATAGATVVDCTVIGNSATNVTLTSTTGMGIYCNGTDANIRNCTLSLNKGDNINVQNVCLITGNQSTFSAAAGIHLLGTGSRVEDNLVGYNARGIEVSALINVIMHNAATGNSTNYLISAGNRVATIISPAANTAISGSSGGTAFSTDGFSNLSF